MFEDKASGNKKESGFILSDSSVTQLIASKAYSPYHLTCIIGCEELLWNIIFFLPIAEKFKHLISFTFLIPNKTTVKRYEKALNKSNFTLYCTVPVDYDGDDDSTTDKRSVSYYFKTIIFNRRIFYYLLLF